MKKRLVSLVSLVLLCALLSACGMSGEERRQARALLREETPLFEQAAKQLYGETAAVRNVAANTRFAGGNLLFDTQVRTTGSLRGEVQIGAETFWAVYSPETDTISSQRHYAAIAESVRQFFAAKDLDILEVVLLDSTRGRPYLPDPVDSFETLLAGNYSVSIRIFVTGDLTGFKEDDFAAYEELLSGCEVDDPDVHLTFVALADASLLEEILQEDRRTGAFLGEYGVRSRVYDNEAHGYVDAFEKYSIASTLLLQYNDKRLGLYFTD